MTFVRQIRKTPRAPFFLFVNFISCGAEKVFALNWQQKFIKSLYLQQILTELKKI